MRIEIDQSGRIEYTSKDTVLALSNDIHYSIKIPAKVKRQLQEMFRRQGKPKLFVLKSFASGIVLLTQKHLKNIDLIIIDQEYYGNEVFIKDMVLQLLSAQKFKQPEIRFGKIGKKAKAHYIAYKTAIGKMKPNETISLEQISKLAIKKRPRALSGPRRT